MKYNMIDIVTSILLTTIAVLSLIIALSDKKDKEYIEINKKV